MPCMRMISVNQYGVEMGSERRAFKAGAEVRDWFSVLTRLHRLLLQRQSIWCFNGMQFVTAKSHACVYMCTIYGAESYICLQALGVDRRQIKRNVCGMYKVTGSHDLLA